MKNFKRFACAMLSVAMIASAFAGCKGKNRTAVIGINQYGEHASLDNCREGFISGLKKAGLKEGVDFELDYQNAGFDDAAATQISQSFASKDVDMMCAIATPSAVACYAAAEEKDIPVIFTAVNDPEKAKVNTGNITGTSDKLPVEGQLKLIRAMQPTAKTIGIIYTTSESNSVSTIAEYEKLAANYNFKIESIGVTAQAEVTQAVDTLIKKKVDCFSNLTDNNVVGVLQAILEKTNDAKIPVYGSEVEQVVKGCVAGAGIDYVKLGEQTGEMAAKVLKGEKKASEMDYEVISEYGTYVNSAACKALNVTVPDNVKSTATETAKN